MKNYSEDKLARAKKRVDQIKGFYVHLGVYLVVNMFILVSVFVSTLNSGESFWKWSTFFTAIFWGLGLLFHGLRTFSISFLFGKNWEERQIQKYIEEDKRESEKYR